MTVEWLPPWEPWWEAGLVLAAGTAILVCLALLVERLGRSAVWQRTIWQVTVVGLLGLLVVETTGVGPAVVRCWRIWPVPELLQRGAGCQPAKNRADHQSAKNPADWQSAPRRADQGGQSPFPLEVPATDHAAFSLSAQGLLFDEFLEPVPLAQAAAERSAATDWIVDPPGATAGLPGSAENVNGVSSAYGLTAAAPAGMAPASAGAPWWLGAVWAVGAAVALGRMAWGQRMLRLFCRRCRPLGDEALRGLADALSQRLGLRQRVRLLASEGLGVPVAFGWLRPTVVLPGSFARDFKPAEQQAVLAHELAHLASGDPLWQALAGLLCGALWWHPLAWVARRCLLAANEAAADEASLLTPGGPKLLAALLVTLGRRLARPPRWGWLSVRGSGFRSALGRRVERLLRLPARPWQPAPHRRLLSKTITPVLLICVAIGCTAWARPQAPFPEGGTTMSVLSSSWRCSLVGTALWALLGANCGNADTPQAAADPPAAALENALLADGNTLLALADEGEKPGRKDAGAREGDRPRPKDGEAREGDRPRPKDAEAREGDRPRPKDGEAREGDRPRPRGEAREGERPDRPREPSPEAMQHRRELEEQARQIKQRLDSLPPGQDAEARELKNKFERIVQELRGMAGPPQFGPRPDREAVMRQLEEIKRKVAELREAGKPDEAERLERAAREMIQRLERGPEAGPTGPDRPEGPADIERRLQHLRAAAENLRAAGLHDQAEQVMRLIERGRAGGPEGRLPRPEGAPEGRARPGTEGVQQLREEVQQMRREMQQLREQLRLLLEHRDRPGAAPPEHRDRPKEPAAEHRDRPKEPAAEHRDRPKDPLPPRED